MGSKQVLSNFVLGNTVSMSCILWYPSPSKKRGMPRTSVYMRTVPMNFLIPVMVVGGPMLVIFSMPSWPGSIPLSQVGDVLFEEVTFRWFQLQSMMGKPVQYCL